MLIDERTEEEILGDETLTDKEKVELLKKIKELKKEETESDKDILLENV